MLEVLDPGPLTSVQTPSGRRGWQHLGVPVGGAADAWSARLANRLVGAGPDAPLLEATIAGPTLRFEAPTLVALTGSPWEATLDGLPLPPNQSRATRAGSLLRVGTGPGLRAYVAIGGLAVDEVLGSASTDLRSGFGGHEGRALRVGDHLRIEPRSGPPLRWRGSRDLPPTGDPVRLLPGPHAGDDLLARLVAPAWRVSDAADRTGVRLESGSPLSGRPEVPSMGLPAGAIQLPPDGRPIVMLADRPVTGGYPVLACVIRADVGRVARLRPGDDVRFAQVSSQEAVAALRAAEAALDDVEPFSLTADDETAWAG